MRQMRGFVALALVLILCGCGPAASRAAQPSGTQTASLPQEEQVWVSFEDNGGTGRLPEALSAPQGEAVVLPAAELSARLDGARLRFVGWAAEADASAPDYLPGESLTLEGDLTLYAVYGEGRYQVVYQTEAGTSSEEVSAGETPREVPELPEGSLGWRDETGSPVDPAAGAVWTDRTFSQRPAVALNTQDHAKYMDGISDGLFHPDQDMTRAEVAQVLYGLLLEPPEGRASYSDVPEGMWYTQAVTSLGALWLLDRGEGTAFQPDVVITRGEFAQILSRFLPLAEEPVAFLDVPEGHPAYGAVCACVSTGLFQGYPDGTFRPDEALTRAEAAVVFNHLLGRTPDANAIATAADLRIFPDVPPSHWAYAQIMEATVSHDYTNSGGEVWTRVEAETTVLPDGYYRFDGWLYRVQSGVFLRSTTVDGFTYDAQGRYTTGSAALDEQLHQIIDTYTNAAMTRDEKLRALYNYVRDNFTYLRRDLISKGQTGWEPAYAEEFLELGRGNCYSFSATFCLLARQLGLPAYTVVGALGGSNSPHGWVEINLDGTTYMFDTQLEWRYLHDYGQGGYDLFMMLPSRTPFVYLR